MTVAVFLHPHNSAHQVFICQGERISPTLHLKLLRLAQRSGHQILLIGQQHPDVHRVLTATPAFTPDALRADVVSAPTIQHALAHLRAVSRTVFILHAREAVISDYDRHLTRPARTARTA